MDPGTEAVENLVLNPSLSRGPKFLSLIELSSIQIYSPKLGWLIGPVLAIYAFNLFHVFFSQFEIKNVEVLLQSI